MTNLFKRIDSMMDNFIRELNSTKGAKWKFCNKNTIIKIKYSTDEFIELEHWSVECILKRDKGDIPNIRNKSSRYYESTLQKCKIHLA